MRILLATGNEDLDKYLKKNTNNGRDSDAAIDEVYYREALIELLKESKYDVAVISAFLNGKGDMTDIVFQLRMADVRVIMLMGNSDKRKPEVFDLIAMGVYDILFSPISVKQIEETIENPKKFSDILKELNVQWVPESKNLIAKFKDFIQGKPNYAAKGESKEPLTQAEQNKNDKKANGSDSNTETMETNADESPKPTLKPNFFGRIKIKASKTKKIAESSKENEIPHSFKKDEYRARGIAVIGADENVGSTAFAVAIAKFMQQKGEKVRIADVGGGAKRWLTNDTVECVDKADLMPGYITIFDVGRKIQSEAMPLAQHAFIIADARAQSNPNLIMPYVVNNTYLVGNKGMDIDVLFAIASLKMVKPLFCLPEDVELITAEQKGSGIVPKKWIKKLEKACEIIK